MARLCDGTDLRVFKEVKLSPGQFTPAKNLHIFRLVQDALTNVIHHAHAANVMIEVKGQGTGFQLQIEDDGVGFNVSAIRRESDSGVGLARMETHAKAIGGTLEIVSTPGRGTSLRVR